MGERDGPLLERDREFARIERCLQRAQQGEGGALVIEGPAGIGKTALLAVARNQAESQGFRVLRARAAELEREYPFGVVRQLVERVVADASEQEREQLLDGPPGVAARVLGLSAQGDGVTAAAPDPSFAVLHGLYWLCVNLAAEQPMAVVVDDVHWADGASLRFLAFLLPRLEELPAVMLLAARPSEAGDSQGLLATLMTDPASEVVTVGPLTTNGVATLLAAGLGAEPEPEFAAACREATGGTPFLIRTLIEALREENIAPVTASTARMHKVATAALGRWAMLRLARLGPEAARLARAVAVLERAEIDQAGRLAGLALPDAATAAKLLVRAGMLDEAPHGFAHPLLREAVYREMAPSERAEAHGLAARLLAESADNPARVAEHLLATPPAGDSWVVEQLHAAGRNATASGAPESAAAYLHRALTEPPAPELAAGILLDLGSAEFSAGQPGWHDHLEAAVTSARDDSTRTTAALQFATGLRFHSRMAEAIEVCDRVAASLDGHDTEGHHVLEAWSVLYGLFDPSVAPSFLGRTRAFVETAVPRRALSVAAIVAAMGNQPADQVADLADRAIAAGPPSLSGPGEPPWIPSIVTALLCAERYEEVQTLVDTMLAEAQVAANAMVLPVVLSQRARLAFRRSDLTAAESDARALLEAPGLSAPPVVRNLAGSVLVDVLVERGELEAAERTLEALAADLAGTSQTAAILCYARGRLRFAQRRFDAALADFQAAGEIATHGLVISPSYLPWRSDAALAALAIADLHTARALSADELQLARAFGAPRTLGMALRAAGLVEGGPSGTDLLREAVEVLAGPDTRLEQARAQTDLGALLRRNNHRADARDMLRQALDAAHHLGAAPLAERADTELRATGAKPRRALLTGLEALTASERRIAELAAEGLTNRAIAQTLFITPRTVEGHLTNVFNKLHVKTRVALPTALANPTQAVRG